MRRSRNGRVGCAGRVRRCGGRRRRRRRRIGRKGLERRVLLSSAIAAFGVQQTFGAGSQPRSVAVADVNGDGGSTCWWPTAAAGRPA